MRGRSNRSHGFSEIHFRFKQNLKNDDMRPRFDASDVRCQRCAYIHGSNWRLASETNFEEISFSNLRKICLRLVIYRELKPSRFFASKNNEIAS